MTKLSHFILCVRQQSGEHEQSLFRVLFLGMVVTYLWKMQELHGSVFVPDSTAYLSIGVFLWSVVLVITIFWSGQTSRTRQWLAMFIDLTTTTYAMATTHQYGAVLFGAYLWVITGNGMRYGIPSLLGSYFTSVVCFSLVILFNDFWQEHLQFSIGMMITLLLVPLYTLKLRNQLNKALEVANEASKVKSQFLAHMSHEMRTPLNGLVGASELLSNTPLNNEQSDLAKSLKRSAKELRRMIDNVLDLIKIESGKMMSEKVDFDLHDLLSNASEIFLPQAELKNLKLNIRFSPDTPFALHGDAMHLLQVLINLLGNAVKFTDKGKVEIHVNAVRQDKAGAYIRFAVSDTGIGIPLDAQNNVFDKFTQADISVARKYGGTGLGTTIARDLVKLMGGQIGFTSTPSVGSVFWFELPFEKQPQDTMQILTSINQLHVISMGVDQDTRNTLSNYLEGWGIRLEQKNTFSQFFVRLHQLKAHHKNGVVIICSPRNFGMNAKDFALEVLGNNPGSSIVSLILLDPDLQSSFPEDFIAMGYSSTLSAPLNKTLLFNALHAVITPHNKTDVIHFNEYFARNKKAARSARILVAEDNETNRIIVNKMLEHGGHRVTLAKDGDEALDLLEHDKFDLLILDMNLPAMSGLDVVKIHRAIGGKHIPVIVLTANATNEAMRECQEANIDAFLTKPVHTVTLLDTVARLTNSDDELLDEEALLSQGQSVEDRTATPLINEVTLHQLALLGAEQEGFLRIIIQGFISETETLLCSMQAALQEQNYSLFRDLAHVIKGSSGNIGADALHKELVNIMRSNTAELHDNNSKTSDLFKQIYSCFAATKTSLLQYLNNATGQPS